MLVTTKYLALLFVLAAVANLPIASGRFRPTNLPVLLRADGGAPEPPPLPLATGRLLAA